MNELHDRGTNILAGLRVTLENYGKRKHTMRGGKGKKDIIRKTYWAGKGIEPLENDSAITRS